MIWPATGVAWRELSRTQCLRCDQERYRDKVFVWFASRPKFGSSMAVFTCEKDLPSILLEFIVHYDLLGIDAAMILNHYYEYSSIASDKTLIQRFAYGFSKH